MSSILAILIEFGLFGVIATPAVAALFRAAADRFVLSLYTVLLAVFGIYHTGFPGTGSELVVTSRAAQDVLGVAGGGELPAGLCQRALREAEQGGLILDRRTASRVSVNGPLWRRVPQQVQSALTNCLEAGRPKEASGSPVEIVEVGL